MSITRIRGTWFLAGMLWAMSVCAPAMADDTELFIGDSSLFPDSKPTILFVLDTSGSMKTAVTTQSVYDPAIIYPGSCLSSHLYWRSGTGTAPDCTTDRWFERDALRVAKTRTALNGSELFGSKVRVVGSQRPVVTSLSTTTLAKDAW